MAIELTKTPVPLEPTKQSQLNAITVALEEIEAFLQQLESDLSGGLSSVSSDSSLDGDGTSGDPLSIASVNVNLLSGSISYSNLPFSSSDVSNWNAAFGWGDHASAGYLTSESDPVFSASAAAGIAAGDISNWDAAFGWGNHASAGYLDGVKNSVEVDSGEVQLVGDEASPGAQRFYGTTLATGAKGWVAAEHFMRFADTGASLIEEDRVGTRTEVNFASDGAVSITPSFGADLAGYPEDVEIELGIRSKNSIEEDSHSLQLDGDEASPGNSKYYGTGSGGSKGFHDLPDGATVKNSLEIDGGDIQLVNDEASPGNNKVYGTDGSGNKGYKDDFLSHVGWGSWQLDVDHADTDGTTNVFASSGNVTQVEASGALSFSSISGRFTENTGSDSLWYVTACINLIGPDTGTGIASTLVDVFIRQDGTATQASSRAEVLRAQSNRLNHSITVCGLVPLKATTGYFEVIVQGPGGGSVYAVLADSHVTAHKIPGGK